MASFPLVSATGMLGSGFRAESLDKAISLGARMIGCDAGSTDPGPGPLATGTCMFSAAAVKRDTEIMMTRAIKASIPLIIGSAGTSGSDAGLAWMVDIVHQIAREQDLHFRFAVIHSELSRELVRRHLGVGRGLRGRVFQRRGRGRRPRSVACVGRLCRGRHCCASRAVGLC